VTDPAGTCHLVGCAGKGTVDGHRVAIGAGSWNDYQPTQCLGFPTITVRNGAMQVSCSDRQRRVVDLVEHGRRPSRDGRPRRPAPPGVPEPKRDPIVPEGRRMSRRKPTTAEILLIPAACENTPEQAAHTMAVLTAGLTHTYGDRIVGDLRFTSFTGYSARPKFVELWPDDDSDPAQSMRLQLASYGADALLILASAEVTA
jgi:hypothetical protein